MTRWACLLLGGAFWAGVPAVSARADTMPGGDPPGAAVSYRLPTEGPLPRTYLVTLAVTDPKNPAWVIGNFVAGAARTVTATNGGKFSERWDGLDDNGMPVSPGIYGLKGICVPAETWAIDGQAHGVIPKLVATGASWGQSPAEAALPGKIEGDPVGAPLRDVAVTAGGRGAVAFEYLENGKNYFIADFTRPIGYGQIVRGEDSGVFAGATSICTDGTASWAFSTDGGTPFIARTDGQPFGHDKTGREGVYLPQGWVTALAAWHGPQGSVVFEAEASPGAAPAPGENRPAGAADRVRALASAGAEVEAEWKIERPVGLAVAGDRLYVLHGRGDTFEVAALALRPGWEKAAPEKLFDVPAGVRPFAIAVDGRGRVYLSDPAANRVWQFEARGNLLRTYGRLPAQPTGRYDPLTFMAPEKLACWTDAQGHDRLLVVEQAGPNRLSEWDGSTGALLRAWVTPQTHANDGYAIDPRHPDLIYLQGQRETLVRWKIDFATGEWATDAVWTQIGPSGFEHRLVHDLGLPRIVYRGGDEYLVFQRGYVVYHREGDRLRACAGLLGKGKGDDAKLFWWRDTNGDGRVQADEYRPFATKPPPGVLRYFGETFFDDLSFVGIGQGTADVWRTATPTFDSRGTPQYDPVDWRKLLRDEIFAGRAPGSVPDPRGRNEVGTSFGSDWASVVRGANGDVYVSARSGPDLSANNGAQYKLSRYVADGRAGYRERWRVGRVALEGTAKPGEVYGPMRLAAPLNGLVAVIDNSRAGVVLYTEDGLYVDTVFPDDHLVAHDRMGAFWQPGEFFAGDVFANRENGKIYFAMGKAMPQLFEAQGWSLTRNPVRALAGLDRTVTLAAEEIATPSEAALKARGGAAAVRVARFYPAAGGPPALDGSLRGWEACEPIRYGNGAAQTVEARCLYDPEHLYVRWHARLGHEVEIKSTGAPEHFFAHSREADTLGLYLQGDPRAAPGGTAPDGRPDDVRFVFGLGEDRGKTRPVVVGFYPAWHGPGGRSQSYRTPQGGRVSFAHVGEVPGATTGYMLDEDRQGFALAVALPRAALPGSPTLEGWRTQGNFDANFGGQDRFWWSNADGSASRETLDEPTEARLFPGAWSLCEALPLATLPIRSWRAIGPFGVPAVNSLDYAKERDAIVKLLFGASFPPDTARETSAIYEGDVTRTRAGSHRLTWRAVETGGSEEVDFAKALGWPGGEEGTAYLLTHIYAPRAVAVELEVTQPAGQYAVRGRLNGEPLPEVTETPNPWIRLDPATPLHLRAGWNELLLRRDFIWGDLTLGARLRADPAILWQLKVSGAGE